MDASQRSSATRLFFYVCFCLQNDVVVAIVVAIVVVVVAVVVAVDAVVAVDDTATALATNRC